MIDIKFIRENKETVKEGALKKGVTLDIEKILELDVYYRDLATRSQTLQAERNIAARERNIERGKQIKEELDALETQAKEAKLQLDAILLTIPNLPQPEVPVGGEDDFEIIKTVGNPKTLEFNPKDHMELGLLLDIIDVERATKVSGARFTYLKNEAVFLELALVSYALEKLSKEGFTPMAIVAQELDKRTSEFAIEILKYNLRQYRTQMLEFNTGESSKFKSFDEITLETIKELENEKGQQSAGDIESTRESN